MDLHILASGSSGNCICIDYDDNLVIIDAGISYTKLNKSLSQKDYKSINLFVTHEHHDHISGLLPIYNKLQPNVYASGKTADILYGKGINSEKLFILEQDTTYDMGTFAVAPFLVEHDAVEPFAYKFDIGGNVVSVVTDIGIATDYVYKSLEGTDIIVLESNYEDELLKASFYPEYTKRRIASRTGHLSNKDAMQLAASLSANGLKKCFLAHISENCNDYDLLDRYAKSYNECYEIDAKVLRQKEYSCYSF